MPAKPASNPSQQRFARLRAEFHELLACSLAQRSERLAQLQVDDATFAAELQTLLAGLDEADLAPVPSDDLRGQRFGPFQVEAEIGRGGMGVVYLAKRVDGAFEQQVALKLLAAGTRSRELAQRFLRERQILARLDHPAIARLIDGGVDATGRLWLAMEYVQGVNLASACQQQALALEARVALLIDVCAAVAYAHSRLIVHRDIKPSNIMIDAQGRPRLLDFGIARLDDDSGLSATLTGVHALTPRYAAPEQLAGERATTAADVFALGIVLRELSEDGALKRGRAGRQAELLRVVAKATAADRDERYAGAAALADDLRDWLASRPLRSGIGSTRARVRATLRQYRWPLLSACAVLLAMAIGTALTLRQAAIAERKGAQASANLDALLNVLAAASPEVYAGREPRASEFLIEAARRLEQQAGDDALLIWRSHSQIGVGLMNLGRFEAAESLLQRALTALDSLWPRDLTRELDTLRFLTLAQRGSADVQAVRGVGERIARVAAEPGAPVGPAISALSSAAGTLSRLGEGRAAMAWLAQAEALRQTAPDLPVEALENYWRQRGWTALRVLELEVAQAALTQSLAVIESAPAAFSAVRRAEAQLLLADVELLRGQAAAAQSALAKAQPVLFTEYAPGHSERVGVLLIEVRLLLAAGDARAALATLDSIADQLRDWERGSADDSQHQDAQVARALRAQALAVLDDCPAALGLLAGPEPALLLNRRAIWQSALSAVASLCRRPASTPPSG
ncbi:MAG: serine/threonine protein kinase [Rhodanobacteraceae bacterium]|nr:serine/threonine protein kinase [Rhodanobacteraceae bacterium]